MLQNSGSLSSSVLCLLASLYILRFVTLCKSSSPGFDKLLRDCGTTFSLMEEAKEASI